MDIIVGIVVVLFVPVCVLLTISILLQDSKGEGLSGSAFGASEMQSLLGGRGAATFLSKLTTYVAIAFMIISLFLMRFYGGGSSGTLTPLQTQQEQTEVSVSGDEADETVGGAASTDEAETAPSSE
jgi:preprotein translocase subunit SecG